MWTEIMESKAHAASCGTLSCTAFIGKFVIITVYEYLEKCIESSG